jgi:hypothetical protein
LRKAKTRVIIKGCGHLKTTGEIDTVVKGEDPTTMTIMVLIVKYPWDIRTTPTKEMTAEIQGIATTTEKIQATSKGSSQGDQGSIINHQMTC